MILSGSPSAWLNIFERGCCDKSAYLAGYHTGICTTAIKYQCGASRDLRYSGQCDRKLIVIVTAREILIRGVLIFYVGLIQTQTSTKYTPRMVYYFKKKHESNKLHLCVKYASTPSTLTVSIFTNPTRSNWITFPSSVFTRGSHIPFTSPSCVRSVQGTAS